MTRHRRTRSWWPKRRTAQPIDDAVTEPMAVAELDTASTDSVELVADVSQFARVLEAGVAATRRRLEPPQPDRAHLDRHGPFLRADAVVPPPGGVA